MSNADANSAGACDSTRYMMAEVMAWDSDGSPDFTLLQLWALCLLDHQGSNSFPDSSAGGRIEGVGTEEMGNGDVLSIACEMKLFEDFRRLEQPSPKDLLHNGRSVCPHCQFIQFPKQSPRVQVLPISHRPATPSPASRHPSFAPS